MPRKKSNTKTPKRQTPKAARSPARKLAKPAPKISQAAVRQAKAAAKTAKRIPRDVRLPKRLEAFLKAEALQAQGLYNPRKKLDVRKFSPSQVKQVERLYKKVNSHGVFITGKAVRPFQRTLHGYKFNPQFINSKSKAARKIPGNVRTNRGAIVPREMLKGKPRILKDGTLKYKGLRYGKTRELYSGTLSPKQTLALMKAVEKGTFKFPKGMVGNIIMFGAYTPRGMVQISDVKDLAFVLDQYRTELKDSIKKYPTYGPITMEFWKDDGEFLDESGEGE